MVPESGFLLVAYDISCFCYLFQLSISALRCSRTPLRLQVVGGKNLIFYNCTISLICGCRDGRVDYCAGLETGAGEPVDLLVRMGSNPIPGATEAPTVKISFDIEIRNMG
jgi:hypothetical protein